MIGTQLSNRIEAITEEDSHPIDYFLPGADVAEIEFHPVRHRSRGKPLAARGEIHPVRMIVRRTPLTEQQAKNRGHHVEQAGNAEDAALIPIYDYHPMITDRTGDLVGVEADHRRHAEIELRIRDLKHDMGLNHFPTKSFGGNAAWLALNTIAHNLTR